MIKIVAIVHTNILKLRIEKLLNSYPQLNAEFHNVSLTAIGNSQLNFGEAELIIVDLNHHDIDTIELITTLRQTPQYLQTPMIALSNSVDIALLKRAIVAGCTDIILKPFSDGIFLEKVGHQLVSMKKQLMNVGTVSEEIKDNEDDEDEVDNTLLWCDDFKIGVEEIDAEHEKIFMGFKNLTVAIHGGRGAEYYEELLIFLTGYTQSHFITEEKLMESIGYERIIEHKALHESFKKKIMQIVDNQKREGMSEKELIKLSNYIKNWLIHHVLIEDRKYGEVIKKS